METEVVEECVILHKQNSQIIQISPFKHDLHFIQSGNNHGMVNYCLGIIWTVIYYMPVTVKYFKIFDNLFINNN